MKNYFLKEVGYVCEPSIFSIKMIYDNMSGATTINFYNGETISFFVAHDMSLTDKKSDFDMLLQIVLISLLEMYSRENFQKDILYGNIQGLYVYDNLQRVKNKLGTAIWHRS